MRTLTEFLSENAVMPDNIFVVVSKRFHNDGTPIMWEICPLTCGEDEELRRESMSQKSVATVKNGYNSELDRLNYYVKLVVKSVVYPNLNDAELQNSYSVMGAENLIRKMLNPGEFIKLINVIHELNSMVPTFEDDFKEATELLEEGDFDAGLAFLCLQKFNILPSEIMGLPNRERAFILAALNKMSEK